MATLKLGGIGLGALIAGLVFVGGLEVRAADEEHGHGRLSNVDRRSARGLERVDAVASARAQTRATAENTLRARLPDLQIERHPITRSPKWLATRDGFLTGQDGAGRGARANPGDDANANATVRADDPHRFAKRFVNEHAALFGHDATALERAAVRRDYVTAHNGMRTTVWQQEHEGLEVFGAVFLAHTTKDGELVNVASQFIPDEAQAAAAGDPVFAVTGLATPAISAADAVAIASRDLGEADARAAEVETMEAAAGPDRRQRVRSRALKGEANVRLCWLPVAEEELRLCWRMTVTSRAAKGMYRLVVDAVTGEVWVRHCLTSDLSNASYRVYTGDSPTPMSPGHSAPGNTNQPATVARQLVTWGALDTTASPNGWINDGVNETRGNNVDAHTDLDDNESPDLPRPQGSPNRVFDFPLDLSQGPSSYRNAAVVNLFYWNNWIHDRLYQLGFTEAAGNFQNDNFGRGGFGSDAVQADAQDGSGDANANFDTPEDGENPRMQMYLWLDMQPNRDGDLDATIIIHEYVHGLSNRRVGGGVLISEPITEAMGEGWSDFYAHALLSSSGENPAGAYPLAAYAMYRRKNDEGAVLLDNYYFGIRRYPCSTDFAKNPLTFKDIDFEQADPHDGVPLHPLKSPISTGVHSRGEIWCVTLWEMRANLIAKHGFATGNTLALRIVTDGMGLCPPNPNYIQARDALLQAEQALTGGANRPQLWAAFARRGLGYYATAPGSHSGTGVFESYEAGPGLRIFPPANLKISGPVGGPFPTAAKTFTLENDLPTANGWTVFPQPPLEATVLSGSVPGNATRTVNITVDANAAAFFPVGAHPFNVSFSNHVTHAVAKYVPWLHVNTDEEPYFQLFTSTHPFDLAFRRITFTPEGAGYHTCRDTVSAFPVATTAATTVSIGPDSHLKVNLGGGQKVRLFGQDYASVYLKQDGSLAMTLPPETVDWSVTDHFARPAVSGLLRNLSTNGGRISYEQRADRFVATWDKIPTDLSLTNSFQIELFFNGVIRITFLEMQAFVGLTGLSRGGGNSSGLAEADFSALTDCDIPPLQLSLPATVTEGAPGTGLGRVRLPQSRLGPTVVNLTSSDTSELTVPASVVIPARELSATFDVTVMNDIVRDGSQLVYVNATAVNFLPGLARVRVDDNENNPLTVSLPLAVSESQGEFSGTIRVPNPVSGTVTVFLESDRTNELMVPPVMFLPAGQTSAVFSVTVIDDRRIDGNLTTRVTATVPNWTTGQDNIAVFDNEDHLLRMFGPIFIWEGSGTLSNAGLVYLSGTLESNLIVNFNTANFFELLPLGPAIIPAGKTNALFSIAVGDNASIEGVRQVALTAMASPAFSNATFAPFIFDNDQPPTPVNPYPPDDAEDWPLTTHLAWAAAEGELIVNGDFESGDFTGWTVGGYGGGGWVLNNGAFDPDSSDGPRPALAGGFSAMTVQNGNGRHTLSQEVFIPEGATSGTLLRWREEVRNHAGVFAGNQRFAVELRDAVTDALRATLYSTATDHPAFGAPTNRSFSLAGWRGERVRIVFVEEDALGDLHVHLDNVSVVATSAAPTTYDIYFGYDPVPDATEYVGSTTNAFWALPRLAGGLFHYWRVDSRRAGITNTGPVWNFRTAGSSLSSVPLTFGSAWKYVATGVDLGTGWRSPSYVDTIWPTGIAPFGFGSSQVSTIGAASNDVTTFYFRRRLTVFDTNRLATVTASLKRDDGAIVYVNGVEALRDNMPSGRFDYLTQAATIVNGADETNSFVHAVDPALFIEGTNIIAVEVHQRDNGFPFPGPSPDLFFDLAFTFRTNTGNLAPLAVNWVQPEDFATVRTPTNVSLRVGVVDDNLIGTRVAFYGDNAFIAEDFITPFQVFWTNPPVGLRTVIAVATDAGGLVRTSAPLHLLVAPAPGQSLLTLIPAGSVWRYRANGEYPGRDWATLGYTEPRDRSWFGGPAQLGYGDGDEATRILSTSIFDLDRHTHPITAYFRHQFAGGVNVSVLTLRVLRDDGVAVYLNGNEVFRNNLPGGNLSSNTLALTAVNPPNENAWLTANLPPSVLVPGANLAAAEVHQNSASSGDLSFDLELVGLGNVLPVVMLTSPANGSALLSPASVPLAATAYDPYGSVTAVQFFRNGIALGLVSVPPYQFSWNTPPIGTHLLTAVATDNLGATRTSAPVTVTIVPAVLLSARALGTNVVELAWPTSAPGYHLETTSSLTEPRVWAAVNAPVEQVGGEFRVLVNPDDLERYFRLKAP